MEFLNALIETLVSLSTIAVGAAIVLAFVVVALASVALAIENVR